MRFGLDARHTRPNNEKGFCPSFEQLTVYVHRKRLATLPTPTECHMVSLVEESHITCILVILHRKQTSYQQTA